MMRVMQKEMKRWGWMAATVGLSISLMGAYSSCSVSCPTNAAQARSSGGAQTCWFELDHQQWQTIHRGELEVKLRPGTKKPHQTPQPQMYTFVLIQDPQEIWTGKQQGRFGWWRLQIKPDRWSTQKPIASQDHMLLRWRLRDQPNHLKHQETVKLVASWRQAGRLVYRTLTTHYQPKTGTVLAFLPGTLHKKTALSVFPARTTKALQAATTSLHNPQGRLLAQTSF